MGRKDYLRRRHRDDCDKGWRTWEKLIEKILSTENHGKLKEMSGKIMKYGSRRGAKLVGPISDSVSKIKDKVQWIWEKSII